MVQMGMDLYEVNDFLDQKCIPENNPEWIIDNLQNPNYQNNLKVAQQQGYMPPGQQPQGQY